jgi:PAS domain S-box-containing protein
VRLSLQRRIYAIGYAACSVVLVVFGLVAYTEWWLAHGVRPAGIPGPGLAVAVAVPLVFAAVDLLMAGLMILHVVRVVAIPVDGLMRTAVEIAAGGRPAVPFLGRTDEVGKLARALEGWRDASEAREVLLTRAPVGICQTDGAGVLRDVNLAAAAMLGYARQELVGQDLLTLVHREDVPAARTNVEAILDGRLDRTDFEARVVRAGGGAMWCSIAVAPIGPRGDRPSSSVVILEDISDRKRQAEKAASVQRELVPHGVPRLRDYELAGVCLPAADVAGDLYDWALTDDGHLDLTLADVMGKGMRAALVMARLQTALATAPRCLGPAARVAGADRSVTFDTVASDLFVTLVQARLDLETGLLRYVNAGHGYCMVVRHGGEVVRLPRTSLPLGLGLGEVFREETVSLGPGDVLVLYSDGLVENGERGSSDADLAGELEGAGDADDMVRRLLGRVPARHADDVTMVVLRRLASSASPVAPSGMDPAIASTVTVAYEAANRNLDMVHETLAGFWGRLSAPPDEMWRMHFDLAVIEIEANIVEHARPPAVWLQLSLGEGCVVAEFLDSGREWSGAARPPAPADELEERGRGLAMARAAVDEVRYERTEAANRWRLTKRL